MEQKPGSGAPIENPEPVDFFALAESYAVFKHKANSTFGEAGESLKLKVSEMRANLVDTLATAVMEQESGNIKTFVKGPLSRIIYVADRSPGGMNDFLQDVLIATAEKSKEDSSK